MTETTTYPEFGEAPSWTSGVRGDETDVAIIGLGAVGPLLAILLAQRGHRVTVFEKHPVPYPKPRAVVFDDEVARLLASAGMADRFTAFSHTTPDYVWQNAAGQELLRFDWAERGPSGWHQSNNVTQPIMEAALRERAQEFPGVTLRHGANVVALKQAGDRVEVVASSRTDGRTSVRARYVVGADGANSFVRERMDTRIVDLGFFHEWLICDLVPRPGHTERVWQPSNLQICDPERPYTSIDGGPGRHRFEFMRMPGDDVETFDTDENAWRLLAEHGVTPENHDLERRALYMFQARWVSSWRDGQLLLVGDAAHLMPPFAGQGMCSGMRDAGNLAWKLDLVLRGIAADDLLDTYASERSEHVRHAIFKSVELGRVICETDPALVTARDAHFIEAGARPDVALPPIPPEVLGPGALQSAADGSLVGPAGQVAHQGLVRSREGRISRLDDVVGPGFHLLVDAAAGTPALDEAAHAVLTALDATVVRVHEPTAGVPEALPGVVDVWEEDRAVLDWLRSCGHAVQLVRPDFAVYGGVDDPAGAGELLRDAAVRLRLVGPADPAQPAARVD